MSEVTMCVHCSTPIEQVGIGWYHKPTAGKYKKACPDRWGYVATPNPVLLALGIGTSDE